MMKVGLCLILSLIYFINALAQDCKKIVVSGNPEYPPFLWRPSKDSKDLVGASADFMKAIGKEIGVEVEIVYGGQWGRVQEEVRRGRIDLIAGAFFNISRLEYMDYFYPALKETRTVLWVSNGFKGNYTKWSDLENKSGVTVINNSFGEEFDEYAKKNLKINSVASLEQAVQMVASSRGDYLIYEEDPGMAFVAKMGVTGLKTMMPPIAKESLYLTMSHLSKCNTGEFRGKISKALYNMNKQNLMSVLVQKNIELWKKSK